jgi:hypothetical protein
MEEGVLVDEVGEGTGREGNGRGEGEKGREGKGRGNTGNSLQSARSDLAGRTRYHSCRPDP